jgi:glycerol-3-phosphate dehydrogenase
MMWQGEWRDAVWQQLQQPLDLLVVGGGITGAGVLREAARMGLKALLVEQRDFAWGTSSRSSKLVHGGLRYLQTFQFGLTRASVRERERLMDEAPGLIDSLGFLLAIYSGDSPGRWKFEAGLTVYDLLALHWTHRHYSAQDFQMLAPHLTVTRLRGGFRYGDAQTDDARLVLRVLLEAVGAGAWAINYTKAVGLIRDASGSVTGVRLQDLVAGRTCEAHARVVVNATGAWADRLRSEPNCTQRIRPLRGSHLIFPAWRLPVAQAISFLHPIDRRPVFVFPWEGITLVGTTDIDHQDELDIEPAISPQEVAYLMAAVQSQFAPLCLQIEDVTATFAGIRPVIDTGKDDPTKESRDHVVWQENGLLTVTGGKLTTFRLIALDVLSKLRSLLPDSPPADSDHPVLDPVNPDSLIGTGLSETVRKRLVGRYGARAPALVQAASPSELEPIPGTTTLWAELRWAARSEGVIHLDDLILRRVRLGLLLPDGAGALLPAIKAICQPELGWGDARWSAEETAYLDLWRACYSVPDATAVPDWRPELEEAQRARALGSHGHRRFRKVALGLGLATLVATAVWYLVSRQRRER